MKFGVSFWKSIWLAAAVFNFIIGASIVFAREWTYDLAYGPSGDIASQMALRLMTRNHGLVFLGILAKLFDVIALTSRYSVGVASGLALIPAAIDGVFAILFIIFLMWVRSQSSLLDKS
jgi:hypothetical protein